MSSATTTTNATAAAVAETNLFSRSNDINCSDSNQKVSATNSDQISNIKAMLVINGSSGECSGSANGSTSGKNSQPAPNHSTNQRRQTPFDEDINKPNVIEKITARSSKNGVAATTTTAAILSRTLTRSSCSNVNGQSIAKSWYARCNRWRSQSCDRRKHSAVRYSWNLIDNRPA